MSTDIAGPILGALVKRDPDGEIAKMVDRVKKANDETIEAISRAGITEDDPEYSSLSERQKRISAWARLPKKDVPYFLMAAHEARLAELKAQQANNPRNLSINIESRAVHLPEQGQVTTAPVVNAWQCTGRCGGFFTEEAPPSLMCKACEAKD